LSGYDRLVWQLFAAAAGIWSAGRLVRLTHAVLMRSDMPFPGPADIGQLALGPLMIAALAVLRMTQRERRLTSLRIANVGVTVCGLAVLLSSMIAEPFLHHEPSLGRVLVVVLGSVPITLAFI